LNNKFFFFAIFVFSYSVQGQSIISTTGKINFDTNFDTQNEATLDGTGLGIGIDQPSGNLHVAGNAIIQNSLNIGNEPSSANLYLKGIMAFSYQSLNQDTTLGAHSYVMVDTSSNDVHLTLPEASSLDGHVITIKKTNAANRVNIDVDGSSGCNTQGLPIATGGTYPYVKYISANDEWQVISKSEATSWSPSAISDIVFWIDASSSTTILNNGNVQQINDLSNNAFHMTQSTATNQPVFNGNSLSFSTSDIMSTPVVTTAMSNVSEFRLYAVLREDTRLTNAFINLSGLTGSSSGSISSHVPWNNGSLFFDLGANSGTGRLSTALSTATGSPFMLQYVNSVENAEHSIRVNGDEKTSNATTFTYGMSGSTFTLGWAINRATTVYEVILLGNYISACDNERIEGYLAWKWGLQAELPSDHTYKNYAPQD